MVLVTNPGCNTSDEKIYSEHHLVLMYGDGGRRRERAVARHAGGDGG